MKITHNLAIVGAIAATSVHAATHIVKAVAKPSFAFQPDTVLAEPGDYIEFHFLPANHSVAKGTFRKACEPAHQYGFFSGYLPVAEGESDKVFKILVENDDPFVFYCTQGQHCASGMFGVVNPTEKQSRDTYGTLITALEDKKAKVPTKAAPFGGALIDNPSLSNSNGTTETGSGNTAAPSETQTTLTRATSTTFIPINPQPTGAAVVNPSAVADPVQAGAGTLRNPAMVFLGAMGLAMLMI